MSIGERIKTIRIRRGLSIDDLANTLGKNRTTIYRYENGDIENLPLGILDSLAEALNTTPAYLMGWDEPEDTYSKNKKIYPIEIDFVSRWLDEIGANILTEEEYVKIMEYGRFLISQRNK